jgi:hypothetical protein
VIFDGPVKDRRIADPSKLVIEHSSENNNRD